MKLEPIYHDAAWHALRNVKGARPEDIQELAERIQALCQEVVAELLGEAAGDDD